MNPIAYFTIVLIWGTTPISVQWSGQELSPFVGALFRMLLAFTLLAALLRVSGISVPFSKAARRVYMVATLGQGFAMLLVYWSSTYLMSSVVSLMFGMSPLLTGVLLWAFYRERLSGFQVAGVLVGVLGLALVFSKSWSGFGDSFGYGLANGLDGAMDQSFKRMLLAFCAMSVAVLLFCISNIWVKSLGQDLEIHPLAMTMGSLLFSLPWYFLVVIFSGVNWEQVHLNSRSMGVTVYLAVFGSILAPYCFYLVLAKTSASLVSLITLLAPVIAMFLGVYLNGEVLSLMVLIGAALVLLSLLIFQFGAELYQKFASDS